MVFWDLGAQCLNITGNSNRYSGEYCVKTTAKSEIITSFPARGIKYRTAGEVTGAGGYENEAYWSPRN